MSAPRRTSLPATDRARILMLLVPYLITKEEVSLAEAAEEFEVTEAQMRTMVGTLTMVGHSSEAGIAAMPNEMFDVDWGLLDDQGIIRITNVVALERAPRFSAREAAALIAGLQLAQAMPGVGDSDVFAGLMSKLARGASSVPADVIVAPGPVDDVRATVADAVRQGVAVSFSYKAPDAPVTTRTVDPRTVLVANGQWYLQGWCHLREAMRTFHLERVGELVLTDIPITHGAVSAAPELFAPSDDDEIALMRFPAGVAPLLGEYLDRAEVTTHDDVATARLRVADAVGLKRLASRRGGAVEILEPPVARRAAAEWARAGLEQYR